MAKKIKPKKPKNKPPMSAQETAEALKKLRHYAQEIADLFNDNEEHVDIALASTLLAGAGIAKNAGASYEQWMNECHATWENLQTKGPTIQ